MAEHDPAQPVPVRLWTSTLKRTIETAQFIPQARQAQIPSCFLPPPVTL